MKGGAGAGAGVLDVHHWQALHPHGTQCQLAADHVLAFHVPLGGIAEERGLHVRLAAAPVSQCLLNRLTREFLDTLVRVPAEPGHADPDDEYL